MEYRVLATTTFEHSIIIEADSYEDALAKAKSIRIDPDFIYDSDQDLMIYDEIFFDQKTEWHHVYTEDEYEAIYFHD